MDAELLSDLRHLADEHFLHLWMQVSLGFLDEHKVDAGGGRFRTKGAIEADNPKQDEDEIAYSKAGIGLRQQDSMMACVSHLGVTREEAFDVECRLRFQLGTVEAGIAEGL